MAPFTKIKLHLDISAPRTWTADGACAVLIRIKTYIVSLGLVIAADSNFMSARRFMCISYGGKGVAVKAYVFRHFLPD
jgi:hypothetical protein